MPITLYNGTFDNSGAWSGGPGNWTYRLIVPVSPGNSNGQIRLTVAASVNGPETIAHFSVGPWSGTKADMSQSPVEVTFGGSPGKAMSTNTTYVSDWVNCSFSGATKLVVVVDWSGNTGEYSGSTSGLTGGGNFSGWNFSYNQQVTPVGLGDDSGTGIINTLLKIETNDVTFTLGTTVLDSGLAYLDTHADKMYICSGSPANFTEASSTLALGVKSAGVGALFGAPADSSAPVGRQVSSIAITDGSVTANGTVGYWAAVDSINSLLLATGPLSGGVAVTTGQVWTLGAVTIHIPSS